MESGWHELYPLSILFYIPSPVIPVTNESNSHLSLYKMKHLQMDSRPGTYALLLEVTNDKHIQIGKLGNFLFWKGYYLYVGSAFGPGGLKSRVGRHILVKKKKRWHIDYLREKADLIDIWYTTDSQKLECKLARSIITLLNGFTIVKGFGASDCKCTTHLFYFMESPSSDLRKSPPMPLKLSALSSHLPKQL